MQATSRVGSAFMREAWRYLQSLDATNFRTASYCYKNHRVCPYPVPRTDADGIHVHCSGPTCVDFSALGSNNMWLGKSSIPFLTWLWEKVAFTETAPDIMIIENVMPFDEAMLGELTSRLYDMHVFPVSPRDFGWPVNRARKYMVLLKRGRIAWDEAVASDPLSAFKLLFHRPLRLDGRAFWRAPEDVVDKHHANMARRRNLPARQLDGTPWPGKRLLSPSVRERVKKWEESLGFNRNLSFAV